METAKNAKNAKNFNCINCVFNCSKQSDWNRQSYYETIGQGRNDQDENKR